VGGDFAFAAVAGWLVAGAKMGSLPDCLAALVFWRDDRPGRGADRHHRRRQSGRPILALDTFRRRRCLDVRHPNEIDRKVISQPGAEIMMATWFSRQNRR